jgi:MraZ protein
MTVESVESVENLIVVKEMWGEKDSTIDTNNGRMSIPAKFRDALDGGFMIARHVERGAKCLKIYTKSAWRNFLLKIGTAQQAEKSKILRKLGAEAIELDKQGRFSVPAKLRTYAELEDELVVIGMGDTAEIWAAAIFTDDDDMDDISDIFDKHGI